MATPFYAHHRTLLYYCRKHSDSVGARASDSIDSAIHNMGFDSLGIIIFYIIDNLKSPPILSFVVGN